MSTGRPTKYNPEIGRQIIKLLRAAPRIQTATDYANISERTFRRWLDDPRKLVHDEITNTSITFREAVAVAVAHGQINLVAVMNLAANGYEKTVRKKWSRTVVAVRTTKLKDGTIIKEPITIMEHGEDEITTFEKDWRAAQALLRAHWPKIFSDRHYVDIEPDAKAQPVIILRGVTLDEI